MPNPTELIKIIAKELALSQTPSILHEQEASWIVQHVLKNTHFLPYGRIETTVSPLELARIQNLVARRIQANEPLGYLLESVPFCGLAIQTQPPILIPRMETEEWCELLIEKLKTNEWQNFNILDLCTGSGCIALALANAFKQAKVTGIDINPQAIELAQANAKALSLKNVQFLQANLFETLNFNDQFDLIVSNPPYVTADEWQALTPEVKNWEDKNALVAEDFGLIFYPQIAKLAAEKLSSNGQLVVEIGNTQSFQVAEIFKLSGFSEITIFKDLFGQDRAVFCKKL